MKLILALMAGVVLASTSVAAAPLPPPLPQGEYRFDGELKVIGALQKERVLSPFEAGSKRIDELQSIGYACIYVDSRQALCRKNIGSTELPRKVAQRLTDRYAKYLRFEFLAPTGAPNLVNDSELLKEWVIPQPVRTTEGSVSAYALREHRDVRKIRWIQSSGQYPAEIGEIILESPETLSFIQLVSDPHDEKTIQWKEYQVAFPLRLQSSSI